MVVIAIIFFILAPFIINAAYYNHRVIRDMQFEITNKDFIEKMIPKEENNSDKKSFVIKEEYQTEERFYKNAIAELYNTIDSLNVTLVKERETYSIALNTLFKENDAIRSENNAFRQKLNDRSLLDSAELLSHNASLMFINSVAMLMSTGVSEYEATIKTYNLYYDTRNKMKSEITKMKEDHYKNCILGLEKVDDNNNTQKNTK